MRRAWIGLVILALGGCSERVPDHDRTSSADVAEPPAAGPGPGIAVTAAPGVAFNYRYAFRLPAARIAGAQEKHAQACEKLGIARCRITGMRYSLSGEDRIDAMLAFKLDPALARAFGRDGIAAIEAAEGMLVDAEITGTDAGAAITRIEGARSQLADARARIDRELRQPGLGAAARAELVRQRGELDAETRSATSETADQRAALANTPMTFDYRSGAAIRSFDPRSPFTQAADTALASAQFTLGLLLGAIALLGPPALVLLVALLLWRRFGRRLPAFRRRLTSPAATPE